jgi:hypothetical protein
MQNIALQIALGLPRYMSTDLLHRISGILHLRTFLTNYAKRRLFQIHVHSPVAVFSQELEAKTSVKFPDRHLSPVDLLGPLPQTRPISYDPP